MTISTILEFKIFWLEKFTYNELMILFISGCTSSHWTERRPVWAFKSLSYCPLWGACQVFLQQNEYWTKLLHVQGNELIALTHKLMQKMEPTRVILIWVAIWKLLMLVVENKNRLLIINTGMETGFVFGPNPDYKIFRSAWHCKKRAFIRSVVQLHKVFSKILAQTVCWA